jgi:putative selenium metabolism protein SsnA
MAKDSCMLVGNGVVLTMGDDNRVIADGAVLIEGGVVKEIGAATSLRADYPGIEFLDAGGRTILPGFICAHHHLYSTFACGLAPKPSANFVEILENLWWRLDRALTLEDVALSALIPIARAIRAGTTTIIDHHASPSAIRGSLGRIGDVVLQAGIRASLCYEVTDRNGRQGAEEGIAENAAWLERAQGDATGRLHGLVGLHAGMTVSHETLGRCVSLMHRMDSGLHVHVAEDAADQADSLQRYGQRVVNRLRAAGGLGRRTLAIHGVHLADEELDILGETETTVIHNPQSNMNNAVGAARVLEMVRRGITVGLGTDGMTSDMKEEVRAALWLRHHEQRDPRVGFLEVAGMLTRANPAIAARLFGKPLGRLAVGAPADLIISDHIPFTPLTPENVLGQLLFGVCAAPVDTTIVDGKVLMRHHELTTLDWGEICARAATVAPALWQRFAALESPTTSSRP